MDIQELLPSILPLIVGTVLPWMITSKIKETTEKQIKTALDTRPDIEAIRLLFQEESKKTLESAADRFAARDSVIRLETKIDSLASKDSVASLSGQMSTILTILEHLRQSLTEKQK